MLAAGEELAEAARQALGVDMQFEDITEYVLRNSSPHHLPQPVVSHIPSSSFFPLQLTWAPSMYRAEAKRVLHAQAPSDSSEIQYLLEYYALVREGKTNYISTCAFHDITGQHPQEPVDFLNVYAAEFKTEHASKKRKTMNGK
jgi:hypothetical protein